MNVVIRFQAGRLLCTQLSLIYIAGFRFFACFSSLFSYIIKAEQKRIKTTANVITSGIDNDIALSITDSLL